MKKFSYILGKIMDFDYPEFIWCLYEILKERQKEGEDIDEDFELLLELDEEYKELGGELL